MATSSFLKNVDINDKDVAQAFVEALECAELKKNTYVSDVPCRDATVEDIRALSEMVSLEHN